MSPPEFCPDCGAARSGGICPRCLIRLGLDGPALSLGPDGAAGATIDTGTTVQSDASILDTIAMTLGPVPCVLLRDTEVGPAPTTRPAPADLHATRYRIDGEIARGGMGIVLRGRDPDLGREVALKILRDEYRHNPGLVGRFVEEAQIAGQLQHPGVVPIYEFGTLADCRPYFAMKLVRGRTLAEMLAARAGPETDPTHFLAIFEQIGQAVAYAHARGVIHRDLKPSNVMVGSFGEVQVMDWGLAKVLRQSGATDEERVGEIATARSGDDSDGDHTRPGSIMGTPACMAPEQARGDVDRIDERADVFALGSILCEILTGSPAFVGRNSTEILQMAAQGDTADALARLDASGADAELAALARSCLAVDPSDRPRDAREVTRTFVAYRSAVQARLKLAELAQVEAQARAEEERKRAGVERDRRRLTVALAAAVLAIVGLGGLGVFAYQQQTQKDLVRSESALALATQRLGIAREGWTRRLDDSGYASAVESAESAAASLTDRLPGALRGQVRDLLDRARVEARTARSDRDALAALTAVRAARSDPNSDPLGQYAARFGDLGIRLDGRRDPAALAASLRAGRPAAVVERLATFLDDWAMLLRQRGHDPDTMNRVTAIAGALDPDPWRSRLRDAIDLDDEAERLDALKALAQAPDASRQLSTSRTLLGLALIDSGEAAMALALMEVDRWRHPDDPWVFSTLGQALRSVRPARTEDALRAFTAAATLHPEMAFELAMTLRETGRTAEAVEVLDHLARARPDPFTLFRLGEMQGEIGLAEDSRRSFDQSEALSTQRAASHPDDPLPRLHLGLVLSASSRLQAAASAYRETIRLEPKSFAAWSNLGLTLEALGDLPGSLEAFREAVKLRPRLGEIHSNLGKALLAAGDVEAALVEGREAIALRPELSEGHVNLGNALLGAGDPAAAIAEYRTAIRLRPDFALGHSNLGHALLAQGDTPAAIAAYREAIAIKPDLAEAHSNLSEALRTAGDAAGSFEAARRAVALKPELAEGHLNLGNALLDSGDPAGAVESYEEAMRLKPEMPQPHLNLGMLLFEQGAYAKAVEALRAGHELGRKQPGWRYPSAEWVAEAERMAALADRLPGVLRGEIQPADTGERLALALIAYRARRYESSARLFAEVLAADPTLGGDLVDGPRYNAACAAALAAAAKAEGEPPPDADARAALRRQALDWLRAELDAWSLALDSEDPKVGALVAPTLRHWQSDSDLAGVRDPAALDTLPEAERSEWQALWAEVESLRAAADGR